LQSIQPNSRWFFTAHHELGHGYYFKAYTRPEVPYLLRVGAAPGFHEGVGELISLASSQVPYLQSRGVLPHEFKADKTAFLLDDALALLGAVRLFLLWDHAALGGGHLRAQFTGGSMECALVEIRQRFSRHRTA
jgi:peptidyl-dipeptidase A